MLLLVYLKNWDWDHATQRVEDPQTSQLVKGFVTRVLAFKGMKKEKGSLKALNSLVLGQH